MPDNIYASSLTKNGGLWAPESIFRAQEKYTRHDLVPTWRPIDDIPINKLVPFILRSRRKDGEFEYIVHWGPIFSRPIWMKYKGETFTFTHFMEIPEGPK